jgi:capsule biosynthesis phosphatase
MKRLIIDLDDTICVAVNGDYKNATPIIDVIAKIRDYKKSGFDIVIYTSRNMRTHNGNVGVINAYTLPIIIDWLKLHNVPYDELYVGKAWCGHEGFYVDDKAIRPKEFLNNTYEQIKKMIS